ncbi:hypothetical protein AK830_g4289 [Neonectria ditissima]|uniref:Uncharacterized protein n=1 Tax=Neonectria ditissima TaxID=78410 RepID=A0A0P7BLR0_9HYPO|nr:hypothetical protein AK830_g4289 [Neonectria ditissima]
MSSVLVSVLVPVLVVVVLAVGLLWYQLRCQHRDIRTPEPEHGRTFDVVVVNNPAPPERTRPRPPPRSDAISLKQLPAPYRHFNIGLYIGWPYRWLRNRNIQDPMRVVDHINSFEYTLWICPSILVETDEMLLIPVEPELFDSYSIEEFYATRLGIYTKLDGFVVAADTPEGITTVLDRIARPKIVFDSTDPELPGRCSSESWGRCLPDPIGELVERIRGGRAGSA